MKSSIALILIACAIFISLSWAENSVSYAAGAASHGSNSSSQSSMNMTSGNASGAKVTIGITAQGMAFNTSTLTVPAASNVTLIFNNQDSGVPHNVAIYQSSALNNPVYQGEIINGPKAITYRFTAPSKPGTYYFQCDVHPSMNGRFIVK